MDVLESGFLETFSLEAGLWGTFRILRHQRGSQLSEPWIGLWRQQCPLWAGMSLWMVMQLNQKTFVSCRLSLAHITISKHMDHTGTIFLMPHIKGTALITQKGHWHCPHSLVSYVNLRSLAEPLALVTLQVVHVIEINQVVIYI